MDGLFQESSLRSLLHNEVYAGDLLFQKAFVTDPITKKKVKNRGELPQYYMENAHEAIIDRETWALVQKEHERRNVRCRLSIASRAKSDAQSAECLIPEKAIRFMENSIRFIGFAVPKRKRG